MGIRMRAKIAVAFLSISVLISFGLASNQAFAGDVEFPQTCDECEEIFQQCLQGIPVTDQNCQDWLDACNAALMCLNAVGGDMIQMETISILSAGAQYTAAWMIPVIVSAIGIGIVIVRKF